MNRIPSIWNWAEIFVEAERRYSSATIATMQRCAYVFNLAHNGEKKSLVCLDLKIVFLRCKVGLVSQL